MLRRRGGGRLRAGRPLEYGGVLDERLGHCVAGAVRRAVVLVLGVGVVVGERGRVALLGALASGGLALAAGLGGGRVLLRGLGTCGGKTGGGVRLLGAG